MKNGLWLTPKFSALTGRNEGGGGSFVKMYCHTPLCQRFTDTDKRGKLIFCYHVSPRKVRKRKKWQEISLRELQQFYISWWVEYNGKAYIHLLYFAEYKTSFASPFQISDKNVATRATSFRSSFLAILGREHRLNMLQNTG